VEVEISTFAELGDNVAVIDTEVNILAFDDLGVIEFAQNVDLALEKPAGDFALDVSDSYFFDCDNCVIVYVEAFVDLAEAAFTHFFTQIKHVVLDFLGNLHSLNIVDLHF